MASKSLADAGLKRCIRCDTFVVAYSPLLQFCDKCRKEKDRERALAKYYRHKLEQGKPLHSPMGRPTVPDAPQVSGGYVYDADTIDCSNRPYKLTCKEGHPLYGDNVRLQNGHRVCKTCNRIRLRNLRRPQVVEELKPKGRPRISDEEHQLRERLQRERAAAMRAPLAEFWPYGAEDPLILAIASAIPEGLPEYIRADVGQEIYMRCLEGQVNEGQFYDAIKKAIRSAWGEYAISLDWRREDGFSLADTLEGDLNG